MGELVVDTDGVVAVGARLVAQADELAQTTVVRQEWSTAAGLFGGDPGAAAADAALNRYVTDALTAAALLVQRLAAAGIVVREAGGQIVRAEAATVLEYR